MSDPLDDLRGAASRRLEELRALRALRPEPAPGVDPSQHRLLGEALLLSAEQRYRAAVDAVEAELARRLQCPLCPGSLRPQPTVGRWECPGCGALLLTTRAVAVVHVSREEKKP